MLGHLFSLHGAVSRKSYLLWGAGLMALKYALDASVVWVFAGGWLTPRAFLLPLLSTKEELMPSGGGGMVLVLGALALPFLWVGISLSVRRAEDAGFPAGLACLFVVPFINWPLMLGLSLAPSRPIARELVPHSRGASTRAALLGVAIGTLITLGMVALSTLVLGSYGSVLFFATPFVQGASVGYVFNRDGRQRVSSTLAVSALAVLLSAGALLLFALEGVVCIAMAAPLAAVAAAFGALVGRHAAGSGPLATALPCLIGLPLALGAEHLSPVRAGVRQVSSDVVVNASPERVWDVVLAFPPLAPPSEWLFRLGFAYPTQATLEAAHVGAIRRCEFSTGAFIEPLTAVEPPHRLAFEVSEQPPPLRELSPYGAIDLPHLHAGMLARRGEFLLTPLPGGRTRLTGTTWYTLELAPASYWGLWTDVIIHAIHERVLEHVRAHAEVDSP